ncbi:hypothetical protein LSH36_76g02003 [Paralvinella palmiformis]|uniref:G-protein coupled receptors family 1 profile domain-containing protein n=1 Tax=Paralvinella palmiformis TaxID=53620 RepID=A0AAD9K2L8_9ANNE|nr:hypothetical protein LSH36_76g02003 [Paralvinella palmiformis]
MDRKRMEEIKLTTTFLAVILTFIILWMPFCVTMFISVFSQYPVSRIPNMATIILGCFNSCCNPIIYGVMNKKFRNGYAKLYCMLCRKPKRKTDDRILELLQILDRSFENPEENDAIFTKNGFHNGI